MANPNAQQQDAGEQQQSSWWRVILNAVTAYMVISAVSQLLVGKFGPQKNVTAPDGSVKPAANQAAPQFTPLWSQGTKMV